MVEPARKPKPVAYDHDFSAWSEEQARLLKSREAALLDWDNLAEEIESSGRRDKSEIRSRLVVLLMHLLKWHFQPSERSQSWQSTIAEQRIHLESILEDSPSLRRFPHEILERSYRRARKEAARETGLPPSTFPDEAPYAIADILDEDFYPGAGTE